MSKPLFVIKKRGAQVGSPRYHEILKDEILKDIAFRCFGVRDYEVEWINERNVGRLITCQYKKQKMYITLSPAGQVGGRNSYFQSVATAYGIYLNERQTNQGVKCCSFYFYFLPADGNNLTEYHKFQYRIMATAYIQFLNPDAGISGFFPRPFGSIRDIINERNNLGERNGGNVPTYITDEGDCYHIYGKTFGANQKETTLMCLAISRIADKPVKLFQILDNGAQRISNQDVTTINQYVNEFGENEFDVLDETYCFDNDDSDTISDNLRSPRFVFNLLNKYGGKKCAMCGCNVEGLVQAAHILPVASIRRLPGLPQDEKIRLAADRDNGIWLCENHHKLFDTGLISFDEGVVRISESLSEEEKGYVNDITTVTNLDEQHTNQRMLAFFDMRNGQDPRIDLYPESKMENK